MKRETTIHPVAEELVLQLAKSRSRVVFAESCTGGLISAELATIPGVSDWLCGSAVTYRCDTKVRWLGVSPQDIDRHTAVSREVAVAMATGVLERTPEAGISASITGHLGPGAPSVLDGVVFIASASRDAQGVLNTDVSRHVLTQVQRSQRQREAATLVLQFVLGQLA